MSLKMLDYEPTGRSTPRFVTKKMISYEVEPHWHDGCETEATTMLYWDKTEVRWLARVDGKFLEGYERGEQVFLDFSHGPYILNESSFKKLLVAYQIPEGKITVANISSTSPSELEKIASSK